MPGQSSSPARQRVSIAGLLLLVALVVLLLPHCVTEPWIAESTVDRPTTSSAITTVSPSTAAEKTQYRQNSQQLLAKIIAKRDKLNS